MRSKNSPQVLRFDSSMRSGAIDYIESYSRSVRADPPGTQPKRFGRASSIISGSHDGRCWHGATIEVSGNIDRYVTQNVS